jgi:hypothetical protein
VEAKEGAEMRKTAFLGVLLAVGLFATGAMAQEGVAVTTDPGPAPGYNVMVVGAQMSLGMVHIVGDDEIVGDAKPKFGGGGYAYFDYYLMEILALEAGLGIINKGYRIDESEEGVDYKGRASVAYMEIPIGAKLNFMNFRAAVLFGFNIGLAGKAKYKEPQERDEDIEFDDDDNTRRFNIAAKIALGYGIPVGPVTIVPGLDWSIHMMNDYDGPQDDEYAWRAMNLMFNVGVEYGL